MVILLVISIPTLILYRPAKEALPEGNRDASGTSSQDVVTDTVAQATDAEITDIIVEDTTVNDTLPVADDTPPGTDETSADMPEELEEKITRQLNTAEVPDKMDVEEEIAQTELELNNRERPAYVAEMTNTTMLEDELELYSNLMEEGFYESWAVQYLQKVREQEKNITAVIDTAGYYTATPKGGFPLYIQFLGNVFGKKFGKFYGETILTFNVTEDGKLENLRIVTSPYRVTEEEIIAMIEKGPQWFPTFTDGSPKGEKVRLIIE